MQAEGKKKRKRGDVQLGLLQALRGWRSQAAPFSPAGRLDDSEPAAPKRAKLPIALPWGAPLHPLADDAWPQPASSSPEGAHARRIAAASAAAAAAPRAPRPARPARALTVCSLSGVAARLAPAELVGRGLRKEFDHGFGVFTGAGTSLCRHAPRTTAATTATAVRHAS